MLPGFRQTFEELCTLVIDVAVLVARALDQYAVANIEGYEPGYLEKVVQTSTTTKGRLLHYFPSRNFSTHSSLTGDSQPVSQDTLHLASPTTSNENNDSWCATHLDHGCLTGLTSALYIDESAHPPHLPSSSPTMSFLPPIPCLSDPPSEKLGLYIHSRASSITKVAIPSDCLAFQTGEALELITGGKFRAVPHFVCAGDENDGRNIARNTLAVFTQPELGEIVRKENGTTFGDFCQEVSQRFQ